MNVSLWYSQGRSKSWRLWRIRISFGSTQATKLSCSPLVPIWISASFSESMMTFKWRINIFKQVFWIIIKWSLHSHVSYGGFSDVSTFTSVSFDANIVLLSLRISLFSIVFMSNVLWLNRQANFLNQNQLFLSIDLYYQFELNVKVRYNDDFHHQVLFLCFLTRVVCYE